MSLTTPGAVPSLVQRDKEWQDQPTASILPHGSFADKSKARLEMKTQFALLHLHCQGIPCAEASPPCF